MPPLAGRQGDAVDTEVTGIAQDEPGAAFSGIDSPTAQVEAEHGGRSLGPDRRFSCHSAPHGLEVVGHSKVHSALNVPGSSRHTHEV